jgi:hypothetical protein
MPLLKELIRLVLKEIRFLRAVWILDIERGDLEELIYVYSMNS